MSKCEGLVKENIEQVLEIIRNEFSSKDGSGKLLEYDLQKEFKGEISKIKTRYTAIN